MKSKNNKKILSFVMAMSLGLLSACGNTSSSEAETDSSTTENTEANTDSAESTEKVKIEFFNQKTEIVSILETLISEYESENPNVDIELTTPANAMQVLISRMASDDTPDVFTNYPSATMNTQVDSGYILNLKDTGIMENIQDAARAQWKYNDGEYAATISYNVSGIWYNEDLFEQAGITELPKTWDELMKDCEILQAAGITPFVTSAKETSITDRQLQVFLASSMGDSYEEFANDTALAQYDSTKSYAENVKEMADKMVQVVEYSQADVLGTDQDSATANFANSQGAMMIGGSWLLASVSAANPDINISMMPIPGNSAEETNTCAYPGDMSLFVAEKTEVKDEAIEFVKWMTSVETATKYAEAEGNPSCIKGVDYVAPQFEELYADYVTTGKFILNPDCSWSTAQQDSVGAIIQQLYYDKDSDAFVKNLESGFNVN